LRQNLLPTGVGQKKAAIFAEAQILKWHSRFPGYWKEKRKFRLCIQAARLTLASGMVYNKNYHLLSVIHNSLKIASSSNICLPVMNRERSVETVCSTEFMQVYLKVKAIAKRDPLVARTALSIDQPIAGANELIEYIVRHNVAAYNGQAIDKPIFLYLTDEKIAAGAKCGKVGFADRKNENKQNPDLAVENALSSFRDGIFRLFINDVEVTYGEKLELSNNAELTFIRLTMLAGRLW
jgi:hypothetical protein